MRPLPQLSESYHMGDFSLEVYEIGQEKSFKLKAGAAVMGMNSDQLETLTELLNEYKDENDE